MATVKDFDVKPFLGLTQRGKDTLESMSWNIVNAREWYEYSGGKKTDHRLGTNLTLMTSTFEALDFKTEQMFDIEKADEELIGKEVTLTISEVTPYVQNNGGFAKLAVKIVGQVDFMDKKQQPQK